MLKAILERALNQIVEPGKIYRPSPSPRRCAKTLPVKRTKYSLYFCVHATPSFPPNYMSIGNIEVLTLSSRGRFHRDLIPWILDNLLLQCDCIACLEDLRSIGSVLL